MCVAPPLVPHTEAQARSNEPGSGQRDKLCVPIWATGQIVCFNREGQGASKTTKIHAILATDVRNDSMFGTCLMVNNKYETFSSKDIADAADCYKIMTCKACLRKRVSDFSLAVVAKG